MYCWTPKPNSELGKTAGLGKWMNELHEFHSEKAYRTWFLYRLNQWLEWA